MKPNGFTRAAVSSSFGNEFVGVGNKRPEILRATVADLVAINLFFFIVNFLNETLIAGMPVTVSLRTRLFAVITNSVTARPYGLWQNFVRRQFSVEMHGPIRAYLADTSAFLCFQIPLYWGNLYLAGQRDFTQILIASLSVVVMAGLLGRPCGIWIDFVRKQFGLLTAKTE